MDDFFGRVNRSRVTRCLKEWFAYATARAMASESVVKRPGSNSFVLPYGFVQSPILASLALDKSKLGAYLRSLHGRGKLKVSVYVDDIIVSGDDERTVVEASIELGKAAEQSLFPLNPGKTEGPALGVTAFNIELSQRTMRITAARLAELRIAYQQSMSLPCRAGIASYVESVNPAQLPDLM